MYFRQRDAGGLLEAESVGEDQVVVFNMVFTEMVSDERYYSRQRDGEYHGKGNLAQVDCRGVVYVDKKIDYGDKGDADEIPE